MGWYSYPCTLTAVSTAADYFSSNYTQGKCINSDVMNRSLDEWAFTVALKKTIEIKMIGLDCCIVWGMEERLVCIIIL